MRKALQVLLFEIRNAPAFLSSELGPAFFDEDDVYDELWNFATAFLNWLTRKEPSPTRHPTIESASSILARYWSMFRPTTGSVRTLPSLSTK